MERQGEAKQPLRKRWLAPADAPHMSPPHSAASQPSAYAEIPWPSLQPYHQPPAQLGVEASLSYSSSTVRNYVTPAYGAPDATAAPFRPLESWHATPAAPPQGAVVLADYGLPAGTSFAGPEAQDYSNYGTMAPHEGLGPRLVRLGPAATTQQTNFGEAQAEPVFPHQTQFQARAVTTASNSGMLMRGPHGGAAAAYASAVSHSHTQIQPGASLAYAANFGPPYPQADWYGNMGVVTTATATAVPAEAVPADNSFGAGARHIGVAPKAEAAESSASASGGARLGEAAPARRKQRPAPSAAAVKRRRVCDVCHKTFCGNSALTRHKRTHTGDKPYVCRDCNAGFTQKNTLTVHMRRHTGERPYSCRRCQLTFRQKSAWSRHEGKCRVLVAAATAIEALPAPRRPSPTLPHPAEAAELGAFSASLAPHMPLPVHHYQQQQQPYSHHYLRPPAPVWPGVRPAEGPAVAAPYDSVAAHRLPQHAEARRSEAAELPFLEPGLAPSAARRSSSSSSSQQHPPRY